MEIKRLKTHHTAMSHVPARPYAPGEQEKAEYYDGLSGHPKLVARTSVDLFIPNTTRETYAFDNHYKQRKPIGEHDIISKYSQDFAADIISELADYPWHRFYPIRIYDNLARTTTNVVVFVIETLSDEQPWETSIRVALACRYVIRLMGIADIEVEIQQVTHVPFAASNKEVDPSKTASGQSPIQNP